MYRAQSTTRGRKTLLAMLIVVAVLAILVLATTARLYSRGHPNDLNFGRLRRGMGTEDVRHIMGEPRDVRRGSGAGFDGMMWYEWNEGTRYYSVSFRNGTLDEMSAISYHTP
jgi:hypothetical protein